MVYPLRIAESLRVKLQGVKLQLVGKVEGGSCCKRQVIEEHIDLPMDFTASVWNQT